MKWALKNKERARATPGLKAVCPFCKKEVIAKCGIVKTWHWSHKDLSECDTWHEPETKWHLDWKNEFAEKNQEVIIEKENEGKHRADIKTDKGVVIEVQNSKISPDDVCDRERFYKDMVWLLNGNSLGKDLIIKNKGEYYSFYWKKIPSAFLFSDKEIYIDLTETKKELIKEKECIDKEILEKQEIGGYVWEEFKLEYSHIMAKVDNYKDNKVIFNIKKIYKTNNVAGWGNLISKEEFIKRFK